MTIGYESEHGIPSLANEVRHGSLADDRPL